MVQPPAPMNFSTSYYCNRFLVLVGFVGALALAGTVRAQSADDLGIYGFVSAFNVDCLFGSANSPGTTSTTENGYGGSATATATAYLSPLLGDLATSTGPDYAQILVKLEHDLGMFGLPGSID